MHSTEVLIGASVAALVIGYIIGLIMGKRSTAGADQARELEKRLDTVTQEKQSFERRVNEHFTETANKLNTLTDNYRGIHEHLAEGVRTLCNGKTAVAVERLGGPASDAEIPANLMNVEQPRDYAPKSSPEAPGMLNESFGLDKKDVPPPESSSRNTDTNDTEEPSQTESDILEDEEAKGEKR